MYLYRKILNKTSNAIGVIPDTADILDFETNYKSLAIPIDALTIAETTFETTKTYSAFKALIVSPLAWSDVKYISNPNYYELIIASENPL